MNKFLVGLLNPNLPNQIEYEVRIKELEQTIRRLRLASALRQYKRKPGRPKKVAAANSTAIPPTPRSSLKYWVPLFWEWIPKLRAHPEYHTWRKRMSLRDSRNSATLYILEIVMNKRGKRRGLAPKHLKNMSNLLSEYGKTVPRK